jgi:hypothetical protein
VRARAVHRLHRRQHAVGRPERAQRALAGPVALRWRPAVDQPGRVGRVLGEVDVTAARVDRRRLVLETAQRQDRLGVQVGVAVERVDLEDVPVVLLEAVGPGEGVDLLARQPGVPGRLAARAVGPRPGDPDPLGGPVAVAADLDDRAAPRGARVVGQAVQVRDDQVVGAERLADLVVVHQDRPAAPGAEGAGPVVVARGGLARVQLRHPGVGDDRVAEALGQRESPGRVRDQRPVPGRRRRPGRVRRRQQHLRAAEEEHTGAGGGRALEEVAAGQSCTHRVSARGGGSRCRPSPTERTGT